MSIKSFFFALILIAPLFYTGCSYDVAEVLYPPSECNTDSVTYSQTITTILVTNCYDCHNDLNAPDNDDIYLEGYDQLLEYVNNGRFIGAVKHLAGYASMPKDAGSLIDCDIAKIEQWIADGAPNN